MPTLVTWGAPGAYLPLFAVGFLCLAAALGRRLLWWIGVRGGGSSAERLVCQIAVGAGALQLLPIALGAAGALHPQALRLATGGIALLLVRDLGRVISEGLAGFRARRRSFGWVAVLLVALAPALVTAGLFALMPTLDPDGLTYHLTTPKRWLGTGSLTYLPTYSVSNTPMGVEMLFAIALVFVGDSGAKCLHLALGLLGAVAIYLCGKRLRSAATGAVSAALYLVGPAGVMALLGHAYLEGAITFVSAAAVLAWLIWYQEREVAWLRCAALLAGVATSFKITAVLFTLALSGLTIAALLFENERQGKLVLARLAGLAPWILAPIAPWLIRAAIVTGNPVFPLFAGLIPSRDFSPAVARGFDHYNRYQLWGSGLGSAVTLGERRLILLLVAVGALAIATLAWRRFPSKIARATVIALLVPFLLQLSAVGLYVRYWMPLFAILQLPIVASFHAVFSKRWAPTLFVAILALASATKARKMLSEVSYDVKGLVGAAFGFEDRRAFTIRHLPLFPLYEYANTETKPDAHILLSYYCGGFYVDRWTYCADLPQDSVRFTTWSDFAADLTRLQVTHVIAPTSLTNGAPPPAIDPSSPSQLIRKKENELLGRLLTTHSRLLRVASDQGIYQLDQSDLRREE
jgi:Dolichyl-phosphate-mannose-protein mannosyltransferase